MDCEYVYLLNSGSDESRELESLFETDVAVRRNSNLKIKLSFGERLLRRELKALLLPSKLKKAWEEWRSIKYRVEK